MTLRRFPCFRPSRDRSWSGSRGRPPTCTSVPEKFAVPEGGERALFAVLSGKIEVVKTFDGIERTLGWRVPGTIFGEVPIALGTPFPGRISRRRNPRASCAWNPAVLRRRGRIAGDLARRSARSRASASAGCRASPPSRPSRA